MFSRREIIVWIFAAIFGIVLAYSCRLEAGEWNEKPVMCANQKETQEVIYTKNEKILFIGKGFSKVRTETGLAHQPATLPFRFYVNLDTGTFTVLEYHPEYNTYCVISYGVDLQDFAMGI